MTLAAIKMRWKKPSRTGMITLSILAALTLLVQDQETFSGIDRCA